MIPQKQLQPFDNSNNPVKHILSGNTPQTLIGNRIISSPSSAAFATKKMLVIPSSIQPQQQIIIPRQSPSSGVLGMHPQPPPSPISRRIQQQQQVGAQFNRIISGNPVMTRNSLQYLPGTIPKQVSQQQQVFTQIPQPPQQPMKQNNPNNKVAFRRASVSFLPEQSPNALRQQQQQQQQQQQRYLNAQLPQGIVKPGFIANPNENNLAMHKALLQQQRQQQQQGQTIIQAQPQIIQEQGKQQQQPTQLATQQAQQQQIHTKLIHQQPQQLMQQKQQQQQIVIEGQHQQQQPQPMKILVQPAQYQVQTQLVKQPENNQIISNQMHLVPDQVIQQQNQQVLAQQQKMMSNEEHLNRQHHLAQINAKALPEPQQSAPATQQQVMHLQQQQQQQQQQHPSDTIQQQHQLLAQLQHINEQLTALKNNYETQLNQRRIHGEQFGDIKEQFNHNLIGIYSQAKQLPLQFQQILLVTVLLPSGESGIPRTKQSNNMEVSINQLITTIEQAYINNIVATAHNAAVSPVNEPQLMNQQTSLMPIALQDERVRQLNRVNSENVQQFASNFEKFQNYETQLGSASARKDQDEGLEQYSPIVRVFPRFQQEKYAMDSAKRAATQGDIFVFRGDTNQELEFTLNNNNNNMASAVPNNGDVQQYQEEDQPVKRALLEAFATASQLQQKQQQQQQQQQQFYQTINQPFTTSTSQSGYYTRQNHQQEAQQYMLNLPQQQSQQPQPTSQTDFNIVTTQGSYQIPPPPVALPPYQPLFSKEISNNPSSHAQSQFSDLENQFEIKTTSKDLTKLLSEAKYAEVSEYAYHTLSEIDMQLIHIKSTIENALQEADMPNTKQLLAEVIESLRLTVKTQEIDISQKAINKLQKNTQKLLHDKTASYELYLYLQKLTTFLQERENILNQSYQANNEMKMLSQSQAEFFNDNHSTHSGSSNGITANKNSNNITNNLGNNFIMQGQQGQQQQPVKLATLFKKQDNKNQDYFDVPDYVPIKEHILRQGSQISQLEQMPVISNAQHSQSVNSFVGGNNTDKYSILYSENIPEQKRIFENEDNILELRKRAAKAGRDEAIRRSSSSFSGRPSIERKESNQQGIWRDQLEGAVQTAFPPVEDNSGSRFNSVQPNRNSDNNNNNPYNISNRSYEYGADKIVSSNNNNNQTKQSLADVYAISSNSRKTSLHNNNNLGANPSNIPTPAGSQISGQNTFQPTVYNNNSFAYDDKLAVSFNPNFAKYQNITSVNSNINDSQKNKNYENQIYFNPPPRQQLQQQAFQQQSPSNSFAVIDNESSPKIDFFLAEEEYSNERAQRGSQDPELLQKMKFYELAIQSKAKFPKTHPAHDYLITSLWEGASSIPESSWRTYINQKLNEKK